MGELLTVNGADYRISRLLGRGKGGYSYLAAAPDGRPVVVKQLHHEPCSYYQFGDKFAAELHDYERLVAAGVPVPQLLAAERGTERIVKEYIEGPTVYERLLAGTDEPWYTGWMRELSRRLARMGLNIDYFPTNFVPRGELLVYVDYECNDYMDQWSFDNWGEQYWALTPALLAHARGKGDIS